MSVVTGTSKAGNGGAPAPGGDGPVDISNWNMYGRASSGRPVVWLVGPVVGTCTETSARCVCVWRERPCLWLVFLPSAICSFRARTLVERIGVWWSES